ncbi:MAG: Glycerate kinase [uncultured Adhaeribacter sp.]|uniref:Glycerate kinase n=1 Tax=uncultured Adhaeribacter sp. TaxID=448109 RepID=A0A6J4I8H9_9BACT|nr:MAG: Glycerate kinase [uncultured Adhaeribacter sp.]
MHIVIAPNAFKHSLPATEVAAAIRAGLVTSGINARYTLFPIADGGEGMLEILVNYGQGKYKTVTATDPLGRPVSAIFGLINQGKTAVIELAQASGIKHLKTAERDPLRTSTFGTGQVIKAALDAGATEILLGVGNSATVDGGMGILQALGTQFLDEFDEPIGQGAAALADLVRIDYSGLDARLAQTKIIIICDVDNPLLGERGAARVFGPQKGADAATVVLLEQNLTRFAEVAQKELGLDIRNLSHGGAAGGTAAGLAAFLRAELVPGVEYILDTTGFAGQLTTADLLITAEGGLDEQTLGGKGPYGVARLAQSQGVPVICLAGQVPLDLDVKIFRHFNAVFTIATGPTSLEIALAGTAANLTRTAGQIGKLLQLNLHEKIKD